MALQSKADRERQQRKEERILRRKEAEILIANAVRWSNNILVEVLGQHGEFVSDEVRDGLHNVTRLLEDVRRATRQ